MSKRSGTTSSNTFKYERITIASTSKTAREIVASKRKVKPNPISSHLSKWERDCFEQEEVKYEKKRKSSAKPMKQSSSKAGSVSSTSAVRFDYEATPTSKTARGKVTPKVKAKTAPTSRFETMLSVFGSTGAQVDEDRLRKWLQYVVKGRTNLCIKGAALVHDNGNVAATTASFKVTKTDFSEVRNALLCPETDRMMFHGVTYCLRTRNTSQIIAFNGQHYIVVNKICNIYLIVYCNSKHKVSDVAHWANKVADKLVERGVAQPRR